MKFNIELNRIDPLMPPAFYKTYTARAPLATHWRPATCEEVECDGWKFGFVTTVDVGTELGQRQYHFLKHDKTRSYSVQNVGAGLFKFVYKPGNRCMSWEDHKAPIGRPPVLLVVGGDWRGNPRREVRRHVRLDNWVEDCALHQDKLATAAQKG